MDLVARDIMTHPVKTVQVDDRVVDVLDRLARAAFNGFPVVDDEDRVKGIVTQGDLVELFRVEDRIVWIPIGVPPFSETLTYAIDLPFDSLDLGMDFIKASRQPIESVMTTDVVTVDVDTPIAEILTILAADTPDINRVPVLEGGRLVGIITRQDLLEAIHASGSDGMVS